MTWWMLGLRQRERKLMKLKLAGRDLLGLELAGRYLLRLKLLLRVLRGHLQGRVVLGGRRR